MKCIFIASELCDGGELFNAMIEAGALTEHSAAHLFKQIMSAVSYIHMNMICHRDLKPENFLISKKCAIKDGKVKLIDFGTAKRFDLGPLTTKVCTVHYVAPEVLKKSMDPYTEKVDVWSAGVVLFVMLAGTPPFHDDDDVELMKKVKKAKWSFKPEKAWARVSVLGKELVSQMLTKEVDARPHSAEVLASQWFRQEVLPTDSKVDEGNLAQMRTFVAQSRLKKVALQVIARQISDDTIEKLRGIFLSLDEDNSGTLSAPVAAGFRKWIQASFWAFLLDPVRTIQGGQLGNAQEFGKESRNGWMELGGACRISWRLYGFWVASGIYRDPHLGSCCLQRASPKTCPWPNLELGPTPLNGRFERVTAYLTASSPGGPRGLHGVPFLGDPILKPGNPQLGVWIASLGICTPVWYGKPFRLTSKLFQTNWREGHCQSRCR
ncbi:unnamed protein product [Effrenium voratum]|uniref:Protein kinase domain-containing protein n=1 Tax=Effrenium voratum TaxID=2562239 RepID=A0AA36JKA2_9DINO|nr:unnamed protein product [Effrenium voratum]